MSRYAFLRGIGYAAVAAGFAAACGGLGPGDDDEAPLVAFDVPRQGDTLSGTVNITVQAFDDDGVLSVRILVDGEQLTEDPSSPYQAVWNAGGTAEPSTHTLRAEARDFTGNVGVSQISVVVKKNTPQ